jgi:hypothetical protein
VYVQHRRLEVRLAQPLELPFERYRLVALLGQLGEVLGVRDRLRSAR